MGFEKNVYTLLLLPQEEVITIDMLINRKPKIAPPRYSDRAHGEVGQEDLWHSSRLFGWAALQKDTPVPLRYDLKCRSHPSITHENDCKCGAK